MRVLLCCRVWLTVSHRQPPSGRGCTAGIDWGPLVWHDVQGHIMSASMLLCRCALVAVGGELRSRSVLVSMDTMCIHRHPRALASGRPTADACTSSVEHCVSSNSKAFSSGHRGNLFELGARQSWCLTPKYSCASRRLRLRHRVPSLFMHTAELSSLSWKPNVAQRLVCIC